MLEISLLGEQRVAVDGSVVTHLGSPRAIALLGFLLLHRDAPQRREYIAAQFWPDSPGGQARTNLRRELHALRAGLPQIERWLRADRETLLWRSDADVRVDVAEFEAAASAAARAQAAGDDAAFRQAAAQALRAYRGDLLPALYDDWAAAERDRLRRRCLTLLDQLIALDWRAGGYAGAIERARQRIDLEPLEEVGYRMLLQLQALAGDRAAALQTYHRCVSVLERELGVAPDQATTAEYERLVRSRPAGQVEAATAPPAVPVRTAAPVRMVGREHEFRVLQRRWQQALDGSPGLALVTGEAGVGKTRLLDELASAAIRSGAQVMTARCFAARGRLPLGPVSEWLRSPAMRSARPRLDPVWGREVDRLVPPPDAVPSAPLRPMADGWQRHRFFEGMARAVLSTGRPTLLILDDLQWCDEDTLTWLQLLLRLGQGQPLLVVAASRPDEMGGNSGVADMLRALRSAGQVTEAALVPLDAARSADLAGQVLGRALAGPEAELLYAATGGYPLFVIESVRAHILDRPGGPAGPAPVRAVLTGRIEQVTPPARSVADLAAVIGRDFTLELLTEASDLDGEAVMAAVDELWRRRIIREQAAASYDFFHDLLRDAAYRQISPARRRLLHRRVAQALELIHSRDQAAVAAAVAYHYERADRPARAVPHHVGAAENASRVFANHKAIGHYRRAAELLAHVPVGHGRDATELAIRNAMAAPLNAHYGYASTELQAVLERAGELAERLGDSRVRLLSLVGLFAVRYVQGRMAQAYELAQRSLELSRSHPDLTGQAHFAVAGSATGLARHDEALPHFALAHQLCQDAPPALVGTRLEVHARAWSAHTLWLVGRADESLRWCRWATDRAQEVDHPYSLAVALAYAAMTYQLRGDVPRTVEYARRVQEICARYEFAYYDHWGLILAGWGQGGVDGAGQIRQGLTRLRAAGALARQPYFLALLAETLISAGQAGAAAPVLEQAIAEADRHDDRWWLPELYRLQARFQPGPDGVRSLRRAVALAGKQGSQALLDRAVPDLDERGAGLATVSERSANAARHTLPATAGRSAGPLDVRSNHDHDSTADPV
jgi:DNA-binding SARP family transcriptional activator/tetratricopeptide (TPR) repeat protein